MTNIYTLIFNFSLYMLYLLYIQCKIYTICRKYSHFFNCKKLRILALWVAFARTSAEGNRSRKPTPPLRLLLKK